MCKKAEEKVESGKGAKVGYAAKVEAYLAPLSQPLMQRMSPLLQLRHYFLLSRLICILWSKNIIIIFSHFIMARYACVCQNTEKKVYRFNCKI